MDIIEKLARILCEEAGGKPDALHPVREITKTTRLPVDGYDINGLGGHFYWRQWEKSAERMLDTVTVHLKTVQAQNVNLNNSGAGSAIDGGKAACCNFLPPSHHKFCKNYRQ